MKNFSQFAVICAVAAELPEASADEAGADDADELDDELELPQAATASASARTSAGARMIRRATSGNRMRVLSLGRMYYRGLPYAGGADSQS